MLYCFDKEIQAEKFYKSKPLFPPSRLSVHPPLVTKIFFSLKSPWNHPLTPGVDPWG